MFTRVRNSNRRRATVMVQAVLFGGVVSVGLGALAIDTGMMYSARQELQNAADAAALAAASQLGVTTGATNAAVTQAANFAAANKVTGGTQHLVNTDIVFGHATLSGTKYVFNANTAPYDAVQVKVRRDATVSDGPVSTLFGRGIGVSSVKLSATSTAMIVPRDIAVVVDLSGSMNDDSELRHYKSYASENGGTRPGVQINLKDVWAAFPTTYGVTGIVNGATPAAPGALSSTNNQPGNGSGKPLNVGGNPSAGADPGGSVARGPRLGWMTGWGNQIVLGSYTPVGDPGLYYIPKSSTCTDADVTANLTESGYAAAERTALLSGTSDSSATNYRSRVKVLLGLSGWRSKKTGAKYSGTTGNGDNVVDTAELYQTVTYPLPGGSWDEYIDYMTNTSEMRNTDSNFRYRYGLKTFFNFLLETQNNHVDCPQLANAPEMPVKAVKDAVQTLIDTINTLNCNDHCSLEVFATTGHHEVNLAAPGAGQTLASVLQVVPSTLNQRQAGYYDSTTNAGAGLDKAIGELSSKRARSTAAKVIIFLSDGKPNIDQNNNYVGDGAPSAISWPVERANYAVSHGMTIYTIGVGGDANDGFLQSIADIGHGHYFFADNTPDPATGQPMYVAQLQSIFNSLGGNRPVRLIQ